MAGKRIVVIDDDPDFLDYVRIVLACNGYTVETCTSSEQGIGCIRRVRPNLVIVDFMMSYVLDGVAVSRAMREDARLADIPILLVSAVVSEQDDQLLTREEKARVDAFLSKPINPAQLLQHVQRLTEPSDCLEV